jgi:hypothetical protein
MDHPLLVVIVEAKPAQADLPKVEILDLSGYV